LSFTNEHLVVCLGASIMRGQVSSNFVEVLAERMKKDGYHFINQSVAGYEAYNVLIHLDSAINLKPDYVVILVGTNDVTATLNPTTARLSRLTKKLPQPHSAQFYRDNLLQIVRTLKEKTSAKIGLISLPVLGEDLESLPNQRIRDYNAILRGIAEQEQTEYLPVYERQEEYLEQNQHEPGRPFENGIGLSIMLLVRHYVLRQSFDTISTKNGFLLVTDGIHLNSRGAAFIVDEIELFLCGGS
jgi:lysophospholipase L1-like esterase